MSDKETSKEEVKKEDTPKTIPEEKPTKVVISVDVELPILGETITVNKLKAGKYYEAQKIYVDWMSALQSIMEESQVDLKDTLDKDGNPDVAKIEEKVQAGKKVNVAQMMQKSEAAASKRFELIAISLGEELEEIAEKYYPEDMDELMSGVMKVNNFMENLKKSVAPTGGLGA